MAAFFVGFGGADTVFFGEAGFFTSLAGFVGADKVSFFPGRFLASPAGTIGAFPRGELPCTGFSFFDLGSFGFSVFSMVQLLTMSMHGPRNAQRVRGCQVPPTGGEVATYSYQYIYSY
jgi:hypothetical protein